jgi:hypothetical protein
MTDAVILPHRTDKECIDSLSDGDTLTIMGHEQSVTCVVEETHDN